jgi:hypothetical protein
MRQPLSPKAAYTITVAVIVTFLTGGMLGADALGIGQSPARSPDRHRLTAHTPLPDLCTALTTDKLAVAFTPATAEHEEQDRNRSTCYWESAGSKRDLPAATLRVAVQRSVPAFYGGRPETGQAREDFKGEVGRASFRSHSTPVAGVGAEAAMAVEHDPDLGDDITFVTRDGILVVRIEYKRRPAKSAPDATSVMRQLANNVFAAMPPKGRCDRTPRLDRRGR